MWPFEQRKTIALPIDVTIELPKTADGHRLDEMVVCYNCGNLVLKDKAKEVVHRRPTYWGGRWLSLEERDTIRHYCLTHAPAWDVVCPAGPGGLIRYRRIPAVPEGLEEIVEAPVRVARKRKPKKVAS